MLISPRLRLHCARLGRTFYNSHMRYSEGALAGIRICDLTRVLAGPYCTQLLGDMGAEVIKIEHPVRGDDTRHWGPPYAKPIGDHNLPKDYPGESAYFIAVNRNKKSVAVDFQTAKGRQIVRDIIDSSDIVVENYIPGTLKKYGLDYETLRSESKRGKELIYASITGYGQTGPFAKKAGYDVMVEGELGLMYITGEQTGPPVKVGVAVTDLTTGMYSHGAILAALFSRTKTGKGQHLDMCLADSQVATLTNVASSELISNFETQSRRWGTAHPSICPYRAFKTKDSYFLIGGGNDRLFSVIAKVLGCPEWASDKRFATNSSRVANRDVLEALIESITQSKNTDEWAEIFGESGVPHAKINNMEQTLKHEQVVSRNMIQSIQHSICGEIKLVGPPVKYSETPTTIRLAPPLLGEHSFSVLRDTLGYDETTIETLASEKVISGWKGL